MMGTRYDRTLCLHELQQDVDAFAESLQGLFDRMDHLHELARKVVNANCQVAGIESPQPQLTEYLASIQQLHNLRTQRIDELLAHFKVPRSIAIALASERNN